MRNELTNYLEVQPLARERKNKARAIGNVLIQKYNLDISKDFMMEIVADAVNADRMWRKILEERPDLRGKDYDDKEVLEQQKQVELGYRPGYFQDVKQGRLIAG